MSTTISLAQVERSNRARIEYPDIPELASSLYIHGFIHPVAVNQDRTLIAGGRRCAALDHLLDNPDDFPPAEAHDSMQDLLLTHNLHEGLHFTHRDTNSEDHLRELELIENVQRRNFSWQEECIAVARIHKLKRREAILTQDDLWGQRETGKLLKCSAASINYCIKLAKTLQADPTAPIWSATNMTEALQLLATDKFDEANKILVEKAQLRATIIPELSPSTSTSAPSGFFSDFKPEADEGGHITTPSSSTPTPPPTTPSPQSGSTSKQDSVALAQKMVCNCDCMNFFEQVPEGSVDHVICDPPYGIDMKNLKQTNSGQQDIDRIEKTHDVDQNMNDFHGWLTGCYKIMKDTGFCVWFCDVSQFEYIKALAIEVGFKAQSWPLTWVKTSNCSNQRAEYNFTKNTEVAIILRKGDARLLSAQQSSVWTGALSPKDKEKFIKHPFIKPDALWGWLLEALALPGSTICDPFSGVGSLTLAAFSRGYQPLCCEIDEVHYSQQITNLSGLIQSFAK